MKDTQEVQEASDVLNTEVQRQEDRMEKQEKREDKLKITPTKQYSSVHFLENTTDSDTTTITLSRTLSHEIPLSCYLSSAQTSRVNTSIMGSVASKSTVISFPQEDSNMRINSFLLPKKKSLSTCDFQSPVIGEGEDYFLSLFGDSNKFLASSHHTNDIYKRFSTILEEVGPSMSSSLGDIEIAEVNVQGLFVRLLNSSLDKELEIGDHILQQNVKGQAVSLYRFLPNIVMQANSKVTAIAWYTPIHWKQAWEKLETDIEFDRRSVVTPISRKHTFQWTTSATTVSKENQDRSKRDTSICLVDQTPLSINREKEIPPSLFPNKSPWGHSPFVPAHPYCPLIDPYNTCTTGSHLDRQPRSQSTRPDPAPGTKEI